MRDYPSWEDDDTTAEDMLAEVGRGMLADGAVVAVESYDEEAGLLKIRRENGEREELDVTDGSEGLIAICPFTVEEFLRHIGIDGLAAALRAINRHNIAHVWLVLSNNRRLYYHSKGLGAVSEAERVFAVGCGGIVEGSEAEVSEEVPVVWVSEIDALRQRVEEQLDALCEEWESGGAYDDEDW